MISSTYEITRLIKDQLHKHPLMEGDRPVSSDRPGSAASRLVRHARPACLALGARPGAFPRTGGHPHPQGSAHAHRSLFEQGASRLVQVVRFGACTASCRSARGSGAASPAASSSPLPGSGAKKISLWGGEVEERTLCYRRAPGGARRSPIDVSGACALALMRAQALLCEPGWRPAVMGWRP